MSLPNVDAAIYGLLSVNANVASWAGTASGLTEIYNQIAPETATLPYVTFNSVSMLNENVSPRGTWDILYRVSAWAETRAAAQTGAGYLYDALHNASLSVTGHGVFWCVVGQQIDLVEDDLKQPIYRRVLEVEIRLAAD